MIEQFLRDMKPLLDFAYGLMEKVEQKDAELSEVRGIARKLSDDCNALIQQVEKLKRENHAMKAFIENEVPEEQQKLIFK